jgi:hypothetical protein
MLATLSAHAIAASGAAVGVLVTGAWLAARLRLPPAAVLPMGLAVWSPPLVVLVVAGHYDPTGVGLAGFACLLLLLDARLRAWGGGMTNSPRRSALVAAMLAALALVYLAVPSQTMLGSRDEGLYTLTALLIERTGGVRVAWPAFAHVPELFAPGPPPQPMFLPGVYATPEALLPQFGALVSAWIAQLHAAVGDPGLFRLNGLLCVIAVPLFHAIAVRVVGRGAAWLATALFALNAAEVWIARVNLSEPLGQVLVLAGLLVTMIALRREQQPLVLAAAACFGSAVLARLDLVLVVPLLLGAAAALAMWTMHASAARTVVRIAVATAVAQALAVGLFAIQVRPYVEANRDVLVAAAGASLAAVLIAVLARQPVGIALRSPAARRIAALGVAFGLLAVFAYAAWWRPHDPPFAIITTPGHPWIGQRDHREDALAALAAYVTWPALVLALAGAVVVFTRLLRGRAAAAVVVVACLCVPIAVVTLANPRVTPDHFWASRRFIPLVLPGTALLAAYGAQALLLPLVGVRRRAVLVAGALLAAVTLVHAQHATLFVRENVGALAWARDLAAETAGAPMILAREVDAVATTLLLGFGRPVAPLRDRSAPVDATTRAVWTRCTISVPCVLLHDGVEGLGGLALLPSTRHDLVRPIVAPTFDPLPTATTLATQRLIATRVTGLAASMPDLRLCGAARDWRADDRGFYRDELGPAWSSRWTDGRARWSVPPMRADVLELRLGIAAEPRTIELRLDGAKLYAATLAPGEHVVTVPLPRTATTTGHALELASDAFRPKALGLSLDDRTLGVYVHAVRLLDTSVPRMSRAAGPADYAATIARVGTYPFAPFVPGEDATPGLALSIANRGHVAWPTVDDVREGEAPVRIGLAWRPRGSVATVLEQRVDLPFALTPGERLALAPPLDPRASGATLPPGDYDVDVGLVHEGVAWFADRGGARVTASVTIAARAVAPR